MAEIQLFCAFCDDVRLESGGKSTWIGVYGGSATVEPGTKTMERLKGVCVIRIKDQRTVDVTASVKVFHTDNAFGPPEDYKATFTQPPEDEANQWVVQLLLELDGMPIAEGAYAKIRLSAGDCSTEASLPILFSPPPDYKIAVSNVVGDHTIEEHP